MKKRDLTSILRVCAIALSGAMTLAGACAASAQTSWPAKPVRIVVPFPAGGSTDMVARYLAQGLSEKLGQQFIVDNRAGAGGNIGTDAVAKSAPDGYTIGLVTSGPLVNNKFLYKSMPFDADRDLAPIALVCEIPLVFVSNPAMVKAANLKAFIEDARATPAAFTIGTPGNGTIGHLALAYVSMVSNVKLQGIPYRGDIPAMTDLLGGSIQALSAPITSLIPNISAGKLRGLAVTSATRFPGLPDIPTAQEQGLDVTATVWFAIVGPAGTPATVVQKLNTEINLLLNSARGKGKLQQYGAVVASGPPALLGERIHSDGKKWQKVIETSGIRID
jgi:tripartite-type tricarboxylate transporter receptor subunit TctC